MEKKYYSAGGETTNAMAGFWAHFLRRKGATGYGSASTAEQVAANYDGKGKTIVITGASSGLGAEAARVLAGRGAEVIMAVRDVDKAKRVADGIKARQADAKLVLMELDLADLTSVRKFAADFKATGKPLHVLMCNAGIMACPFTLSKDGHEMQFATNHLGHFLLTQLLLDNLVATAKTTGGANTRVVVLSSMAHFSAPKEGVLAADALDSEKVYQNWTAYGQSKLCNVLFTRELNKRLTAAGTPVTVACCHPGCIPTELGRYFPKWLYATFKYLPFKSIPQGTATQMYLAVGPDVKGGEYYSDVNVAPATPISHDAALGKRLWEMSEAMCSGSGVTKA